MPPKFAPKVPQRVRRQKRRVVPTAIPLPSVRAAAVEDDDDDAPDVAPVSPPTESSAGNRAVARAVPVPGVPISVFPGVSTSSDTTSAASVVLAASSSAAAAGHGSRARAAVPIGLPTSSSIGLAQAGGAGATSASTVAGAVSGTAAAPASGAAATAAATSAATRAGAAGTGRQPRGRKRRRTGPIDASQMTMADLIHDNHRGIPMRAAEEKRVRRRDSHADRRRDDTAAQGTLGGGDAPGDGIDAAAGDGGDRATTAVAPAVARTEEQQQPQPQPQQGREAGAGAGASAQAAPKVVFQDGAIVLDQSSLVVQVDSGTVPEGSLNIVYEEGSHITSSSYSTKTPSEKWSANETNEFYRALSQYGTDFTMIERILPSRTRKQIKNKFKKEERENPHKIDMALTNRLAIDASHYKDLDLTKVQQPALPTPEEAAASIITPDPPSAVPGTVSREM